MCFSGVGVELKSVNFLLRITESLFPTRSFETGWHGDFMFSFSSEEQLFGQTGRSLSFNLGMTTLSWRFMQEMRRALISASCCDSMSSELLLVEFFLVSSCPLFPFLFLISVFLGSLFALSLLPVLPFISSLLPSSSSTSLPDDWLITVTNIFPTKFSFSKISLLEHDLCLLLIFLDNPEAVSTSCPELATFSLFFWRRSLEMDPITGATCAWVSSAVLRVVLGVDGAGFVTLVDKWVDSDWMVCCTLPDRGREREERIASPVDDRRDAETERSKEDDKTC